MTHQTDLAKPGHSALLAKHMFIGGIIGLVVISLFLLQTSGKPEFHPLWWVRPLIVLPYAGAMAGVFYSLMHHLRGQGGWKTLIANILSFLVLIIGLWLGSVLGLAGTYWH